MEYNMIDKLFGILVLVVCVFFAQTSFAQDAVECPEGYVCTLSGTDSNITTNGQMTTTVKQPPPSAIAPQFSAGNNSDLCTIGASASVQTQILGISAGGTYTEENCKRLKNAKVLYDMGMKVAAVSTMCQDENVFDAMMMAGTPCPYEGKIGAEAKIGWESHEETMREKHGAEEKQDVKETVTTGGLGLLAFLLLL